jgi:glyoxylase-like metal-dependent hydrolase (beta-lactamase superfamily II)
MQPINRRTFIADVGRGAFALAVVSVAACSPGTLASARPSAPAAAPGTPGASPSGGSEPPASSAAGSPSSGNPPARDGLTWRRVDLGFVSAYVLVRGGQAVVVDMGVGGSAGAIEDSLTEIGLGWSAVGHLILTHRHNDHAGSAAEVMEAAPEAAAYAGAEDIPAISVPRPLTPVEDGDRVFDLQIVTTPGHTPGSISVYDGVSGLLVAGDALGIDGGKPTLPGAQFTEDMEEARRSVAKLAELGFETLLVGHGDPIESGASAAVAELAAAQ